jgi:hypothetical protein
MKRRTKIILWVYIVGAALTEIVNIRTGYVMGGYERVHGVGAFILWEGVGLLIAATWPLWALMIALQLLGLEI